MILTVGRAGTILAIAIEKRSGDVGLDQSVQNASEKARLTGRPPECEQRRLELGLIFNPSRSQRI